MRPLPGKLVLSMLMVVAASQPFALAQGNQAEQKAPQTQQPFIEPAETMMTHKTARRAFVEALPPQNGRWDTLPFMMPINPVHVALMHDGKVLIVSGSGNDPNNKILEAGVWDPGQDTVRTFLISWDMFCNGMVILPDGRPFVLGGTLKYDNFLGYPRTSAFNPATETFADMPNMSGGQLAKEMAELRPETKLLFVSGYAGKTVLDHKVLDVETNFLQKPYSLKQLSRKIRYALDQGPSPAESQYDL